MWQRVQTLYLAISTILIAVMVFGVKATLPAPEGIEPEMVNVAHRAAEAAVRRPGKVKSMN